MIFLDGLCNSPLYSEQVGRCRSLSIINCGFVDLPIPTSRQFSRLHVLPTEEGVFLISHQCIPIIDLNWGPASGGSLCVSGTSIVSSIFYILFCPGGPHETVR